jgi:hypothetical protein
MHPNMYPITHSFMYPIMNSIITPITGPIMYPHQKMNFRRYIITQDVQRTNHRHIQQ